MRIEDKLIQVAEKVVNSLKDTLTKENINASGKLSNSIVYRVSEHFIEIEMNKYGSYVDTGTKPRKTGGKGSGFLDQIKEWTKYKGIPEEAAYPIYRKILRHGTKPHPWLGSMKKHLMNVDQELLDYMGIRVKNDFEKRFKEIWQ